MAAGAALSAKKGERSKASLRRASEQMYESMHKEELEERAGTKRNKLPEQRQSDTKSNG